MEVADFSGGWAGLNCAVGFYSCVVMSGGIDTIFVKILTVRSERKTGLALAKYLTNLPGWQ